ncbi:hypothetical protein VKT23_000287 [Stygiomarasmius scandens]|uniref:Uncharacterized protein n=1 Tax=Marasmiellus scandens TaxID=2682957 RepID=A0ABR1K661_9AGAR
MICLRSPLESNVSLSILSPGIVPEIKAVTRFPAQVCSGADAKIPSIIYYDQDGSVRSVGAEALHEDTLERAEDEDWIRCEWFKLHLRPNGKGDGTVSQAIPPPLPLKKTAVAVLADFLRYLMRCVQKFIIQSMYNGLSFWESVEDRIQFILPHPNDWEDPQKSQMRRAAVQAGLITGSTQDCDRVQFVTEGEAILHFCLNNGYNTSIGRIVVVNAGSDTVDLSAYQGTNNDQPKFEGIAKPLCRFTGSMLVTIQARQYLQSISGRF